MNSSTKLRILLAWEAVVFAVGLLVCCGVVSENGQWYSASASYRAQTDALLQGRLALGRNPGDLAFDLCWSEGGMHQVWGLGIPLWRLPFEALARSIGAEAFPDMLALAVAMGLAIWAVMWTLCKDNSFECRFTGRSLATLSRLAGATVLLVLFPPFVNLLQTHFTVYEEAIAYEYLLGLGLLAALIGLAQRPSSGKYYLLCALAGLGGLERPTLVFHGIAAVLAGTIAVWMKQRNKVETNGKYIDGQKWRARMQGVIVGVGLFVLGGGLLFATNRARFGDGFEFGHKLNVQTLYGSLYATRFDHPFQKEPLLSAAGELCGLLFMSPKFNGGDDYQQAFFVGQSSTVRWRTVYLTTYDLSFLVWLLFGLGVGIATWWKLFHKTKRETNDFKENKNEHVIIAILALYGALASGLLLTFYLRNSVLSSRYLLDLMPSFAALMLAAWLAWGCYWLNREAGRWMLPLSAVGLAGWLVWEISHGTSADATPRPLTWQEVKRRQPRSTHKVTLPDKGAYDSPAACEQTGIPFNGTGWEKETGRVKPCVILFVNAPENLELEIAPEINPAYLGLPEDFRAKVGLEFLERESVRRTDTGWIIRFHGPQQRRYQSGIQPVFLATVSNRHLADKDTPWRLLKVRWKDLHNGQ
jgi:hypothetical protein